MFTIKLIKKLFKIINGEAEPWQVFLGAFFGVLLGFLPIWPLLEGPAPLGLCILLAAIVINCHFGSVLLFMGIGSLIAYVGKPLGVAVGNSMAGLAATSADIGFLHQSLWSHTGWLGMTIIGFICAPIIGLVMAWAAKTFREKFRAKLLERKKLVSAGKVASNGIMLKLVCWFFDL